MASKDDQLASQLWGLAIAQGVLSILFGIAALFWPGATVALIIGLFGIFVLIWGIVGLITSIVSLGKNKLWWVELIFSLLAIGLGVYLLRNPGVTAAVFILLIGFTFIARGIVDLISAFFSKEKEVKEARPLFFVTGLLGLVAGLIVLAQPVASGVAFVWIVGLYAILQGIFTIAFGIRVNNEK